MRRFVGPHQLETAERARIKCLAHVADKVLCRMLPAVKASNVIPFTVTYQATVVPDSSQWGTFSEFSEGKYRHVRCFLHLLASRRMHSVRLFSVVPYWGNPSCRTLLLPTVRIYETHCFRPNCRLRELVCQALSSLRTLNNVELQSNLTDRLKSPTSQELHTHKSSHFTLHSHART